MHGKEDSDCFALELDATQYLKKVANEENAGLPGGCNGHAALIILNSPLDHFEYFRRLYDHADYVLCADGGANRVYDLMTAHYSDLAWDTALRKALPDLIHGDLDSLTDHVRLCYGKLGVTISQDLDQYSTDFGKAVRTVVEGKPDVRDVMVLGSIGGRVDQGIGLLHELYREQRSRHPEVRIWLFSEASVSVILQRGTTFIQTPLGEGLIKRNIGILPLYGPAVISTKGLEWDVNDWQTDLGGQVSTSNHIVADQISIKTSTEVLFTVERALSR